MGTTEHVNCILKVAGDDLRLQNAPAVTKS